MPAQSGRETVAPMAAKAVTFGQVTPLNFRFLAPQAQRRHRTYGHDPLAASPDPGEASRR